MRSLESQIHRDRKQKADCRGLGRREKGEGRRYKGKSRANQSLCRQLFSCLLRLPQAEQSTPPLLCEFCHALCCPPGWICEFLPRGVCAELELLKGSTLLSHRGCKLKGIYFWGCLTSSQYMQRTQAYWLKYVLVIPLSFLRIATVIVKICVLLGVL